MIGSMMFKAKCGTRFYVQDVLAYQPSPVGMMGDGNLVVIYLRGREQPITAKCEIEEIDGALETFWNSLEDDVDSFDDEDVGCDCGCGCEVGPEDDVPEVVCVGEGDTHPSGEKEPA